MTTAIQIPIVEVPADPCRSAGRHRPATGPDPPADRAGAPCDLVTQPHRHPPRPLSPRPYLPDSHSACPETGQRLPEPRRRLDRSPSPAGCGRVRIRPA